jgi:frataxin
MRNNLMDEREFDLKADQALQRMMVEIEDQLMDELDVDFQGGILTIELPDGGTYHINKHGPNREIWMSSPKSGAWHFRHDPEAGWISTRAAGDTRPALLRLLADELAEATGKPVALTE